MPFSRNGCTSSLVTEKEREESGPILRPNCLCSLLEPMLLPANRISCHCAQTHIHLQSAPKTALDRDNRKNKETWRGAGREEKSLDKDSNSGSCLQKEPCLASHSEVLTTPRRGGAGSRKGSLSGIFRSWAPGRICTSLSPGKGTLTWLFHMNAGAQRLPDSPCHRPWLRSQDTGIVFFCLNLAQEYVYWFFLFLFFKKGREKEKH